MMLLCEGTDSGFFYATTSTNTTYYYTPSLCDVRAHNRVRTHALKLWQLVGTHTTHVG